MVVLEQDGLVRAEHYLANQVFATLVALDYQMSVGEVNSLVAAAAAAIRCRLVGSCRSRSRVVAVLIVRRRVLTTVAQRVQVVQANRGLIAEITGSVLVMIASDRMEPALDGRRGLDDVRVMSDYLRRLLVTAATIGASCCRRRRRG